MSEVDTVAREKANDSMLIASKSLERIDGHIKACSETQATMFKAIDKVQTGQNKILYGLAFLVIGVLINIAVGMP